MVENQQLIFDHCFTYQCLTMEVVQLALNVNNKFINEWKVHTSKACKYVTQIPSLDCIVPHKLTKRKN